MIYVVVVCSPHDINCVHARKDPQKAAELAVSLCAGDQEREVDEIVAELKTSTFCTVLTGPGRIEVWKVPLE